MIARIAATRQAGDRSSQGGAGLPQVAWDEHPEGMSHEEMECFLFGVFWDSWGIFSTGFQSQVRTGVPAAAQVDTFFRRSPRPFPSKPLRTHIWNDFLSFRTEGCSALAP